MKQRSAAPGRDLTGLVCTAAMGLLLLLAWAALPALPLGLPDGPAASPTPINPVAQAVFGPAPPAP